MIRRRRAAWTTTGIAVVLAVVGCNFIVGVGDYQVGSEDGGGSEDDSGGNADGNRADARGTVDGSVLDTGTHEAGALEASAGEAGSRGDAGYTDGSSGVDDATPDANMPDGTLVDAGGLDGAHPEASAVDANTADVSRAEAGYVDAPFVDVVVDQFTADAGGDVIAIVDGRAGDVSVGPSLDGSVRCGATLPGPDDTAFRQIVNACTLAVSCDPEFFDENISACITYDFFYSSPSYACLRSITNCSDFGACWGIGYATSAEIQVADSTSNQGAVCTGANGEIAVNGDDFIPLPSSNMTPTTIATSSMDSVDRRSTPRASSRHARFRQARAQGRTARFIATPRLRTSASTACRTGRTAPRWEWSASRTTPEAGARPAGPRARRRERRAATARRSRCATVRTRRFRTTVPRPVESARPTQGSACLPDAHRRKAPAPRAATGTTPSPFASGARL